MDTAKITDEEMFKLIEDMSNALYRLVAECCTNTLSQNRLYIVSRIRDGYKSIDEEKQARLQENSLKTPVPLTILLPGLTALYPTVYDWNFHIYKAEANVTIIDVRYYSKHSLDAEYFEKVKDNPPMVHARFFLPPWAHETNKKFDVNWENNGDYETWLKENERK